MPEICRFYGIVITMNYNEHNPPHFHASYQEYEITVEIKTGIINGVMPKRALNLIFEWFDLHKEDLLLEWDLAQNRKALVRLEPLV